MKRKVSAGGVEEAEGKGRLRFPFLVDLERIGSVRCRLVYWCLLGRLCRLLHGVVVSRGC